MTHQNYLAIIVSEIGVIADGFGTKSLFHIRNRIDS
jgi:hypothetical protein